MRILAIDDDQNMLESFELWLAGRGHDLGFALTTADARAALRDRPWDVVLLDQNLLGPEGGPVGLDLIETIRSYSPAATILVVSGAKDKAIQRAFDLGVDDYLIKDQHLDAILVAKLGLIDRLLRDRRQALQSAPEREAAIQGAWRQLQDEADSNRKGRLLEDLAEGLFRSMPGVRNVIPRLTNGMEEFDAVVCTDGTGIWAPFQATPHVIVECKNWSAAVQRAELDSLINKLRRRHGMSRLGIFITWNGASRGFARAAEREAGLVIAVLDRERLQSLVAAENRASALQAWIDLAVADAAD